MLMIFLEISLNYLLHVISIDSLFVLKLIESIGARRIPSITVCHISGDCHLLLQLTEVQFDRCLENLVTSTGELLTNSQSVVDGCFANISCLQMNVKL